MNVKKNIKAEFICEAGLRNHLKWTPAIWHLRCFTHLLPALVQPFTETPALQRFAFAN